MSIWEDCEEFDAVPFYGFPMIPKIKGGFVIFEFPKGYDPDGSQTNKVAEKLIKLCGSNCKDNVITDNLIKVKISRKKLSYVIYNAFMNNK